MVMGEFGVAVLTQRTFMAQRIHRILRFSSRCAHALHVASENLVDQLDGALGTHVKSQSLELGRVVGQLRQTIDEEGEVPESGYVLNVENGIPPSLPACSLVPAFGEGMSGEALSSLALALREAALAKDTQSKAGIQVTAMKLVQKRTD
jgi:hypothetical protein